MSGLDLRRAANRGRRGRRSGPFPLPRRPVTLFAYAGLRCIEEREFDFSGGPPDPMDPRWLSPEIEPDVRAFYVFGAYLDEPLMMERWTVAEPTETRFFYHRDHNYNVVALTKPGATSQSDAVVVERVEYHPYGAPKTYNVTWGSSQPLQPHRQPAPVHRTAAGSGDGVVLLQGPLLLAEAR